jgi:protein-tyrosine phosphatase
MIDLHCHLLPAIDDGAVDEATSLAMARIAVADGITTTACTPHIYPGLYENSGPAIIAAVRALEERLRFAGLELSLTFGADTHLVPEIFDGLRSGRIPTLNGSRYFLLEPPHHVAPPHLADNCFALLTGGYVPIITHPERLTWIAEHYPLFLELARSGIWMQLTSGSLTGRFGPNAQYWAERMLDEGIVHLLATDAHGVRNRPPLLDEGRRAAEQWLGAEEAQQMVLQRPQAVIEDCVPESVAAPPGLSGERRPRARAPFWRRWFSRR